MKQVISNNYDKINQKVDVSNPNYIELKNVVVSGNFQEKVIKKYVKQ